MQKLLEQITALESEGKIVRPEAMAEGYFKAIVDEGIQKGMLQRTFLPQTTRLMELIFNVPEGTSLSNIPEGISVEKMNTIVRTMQQAGLVDFEVTIEYSEISKAYLDLKGKE